MHGRGPSFYSFHDNGKYGGREGEREGEGRRPSASRDLGAQLTDKYK